LLFITRICLIRHGETSWNIERKAQGQSDIPLNEAGRLQAGLLANRLRQEQWEHIFSSDLSRATETANIVAEKLGLIVQTDLRLREMYKGETEGTTLEERIERWGDRWEELPLGIEDEESIIHRGTSFISEIADSLHNKNILVVSHGALIGLTVKSLISSANIEVHFQNTSITIINYNGSDWELELFNCAMHIV
jgi:probable phosphoglycerate mutase